MRTPIIVPAVLLAGSLVYSGCAGDTTPVGSEPIVSSFPNAVGMLWVYEVYDSLTQAMDTVKISITDSLDMAGHYPGHRWRIYRSIEDSVVDRYVYVGEDTVEFLADTTAEPIHLERFVFPLQLGAQWTGPFFADTSRVTNVGTVSVPAGNFPGSSYIERTWDTDFEGGGKLSETWMAPNVGIVYRYFHNQYSDGAQIHVTKNETWELVRYDLSTFPLRLFPNTVGSQWIYEMNYPFSETPPETVTVTIESRVPISWADSATRWTVSGREISEIWYVGVEGNRIHILYDTIIYVLEDKYYDFPLAVGRHWGIETFTPGPIIDDKVAVTVPAGNFASAFYYRAEGGGLNAYWGFDEWLVPGIGIVVAIQGRTGWYEYYHRQWNLLSCDIAD